MKSVLILLTPLFCFLSACHQQPNAVKENFSLNTAFTLQPQDLITNVEEDLSLFWQTVKDRRCPEDNGCKGKGEATLQFEIAKGANKGYIEFSLPGQCYDQSGKCGDTVEWANYIISVIYLNNHPIAGERSDPQAYELRM
ncbi:MAG: hypothetical protein AAFO94_05775, partial [Bacteroidota bacterium]